ncbi:MAG TPA: proline--tRNA ligase [Ktedonobacterales bacterium]|nr:proline--tRNA ligase [Ktedonobacterales bacterium]
MRYSQLFLRTLREPPSEAETVSYQLLARGGFARQLTAGVYSVLPLGQRVLLKIAAIIREEMNAAGGQEVMLPVLQPLELWEAQPARGVSRAEALGETLLRLKDRRGRDLALGPTHEEVITLLAKEFVRSYRDLPQRLYQIQTKFRDELRPRGGLIRMREFWMKDLYSFDADEAGLEASYQAMAEAYRRIFRRCGVETIMAEADSGAIGGKDSHEFLAPGEAGDDDVMLCAQCGYAANREKAEFARRIVPDEAEAALEEVYTPGQKTIADLAAFLHIPEARTLKSVCYVADGRLIFALVRGDLEVNEVKLFNAVGRAGLNATTLHLATPEELQQVGTVIAGFTSPIGQDEQVLILADTSLQIGKNFVAGANREDYHLLHVNAGRDFRVDAWEDLASAFVGATCARCGGTLEAKRCVELGHIFKMRIKYSELFNAMFLGEDRQEHLILMGSYGIGLGRILSMAVEQHHDARGICWPVTIAPYQVALCALGTGDADVTRAADDLYAALSETGVEVLYDDRAESAGIKLNDADLIGLPLRLVVSKRTLAAGAVEWKLRTAQESQMVALADVVERTRAFITSAQTTLT